VLIADTAAIGILQRHGYRANHLGFGDFRLTPDAKTLAVDFIRKDGGTSPPTWDGIEGRPHQVYGPEAGIAAAFATIRAASQT
jgi:hypothetical protein